MARKKTARGKRSTLNTQTGLEKFLKSRLILLLLLVVVSILQTPHTAYVIHELSFIANDGANWLHSAGLALCIEFFIIIFSIQNKKGLAIMYLVYAAAVNLAMSYFLYEGFTSKTWIYFGITCILPISTYFIAETLGFKKKAVKSGTTTKKKRSYKRRKVSQPTPEELEADINDIANQIKEEHGQAV